MWRPTTAAANAAAMNTPQAANTKLHQTVATSPAARTHSLKLAVLNQLHTQIKQYVVTTPDTGRGNKGTSPWGFPV